MSAIKKIYVAGHSGMVGSALVRELQRSGCRELITRTSKELQLTDQVAVREFLHEEKPNEIYIAAARVGGIHANNTYPAEFIYENLMIQTNLIHEAFRAGIKKILFLGSSCIYPKLSSQPIVEEQLLSGPLEPTNEPYAIAKIAGIKLCESYNRQYGDSHKVDFRSAMPTNLYGPNDRYNSENSHVVPALIRRIHDAKLTGESRVIIWGSGTPRREFLHVDDLAKAAIFLMNLPVDSYKNVTRSMLSHINIGSGVDVSIRDLALMIQRVVGYEGVLEFDLSKPDGTPRKLMSSDKLKSLGWMPTLGLNEGLRETYADFKEKYAIYTGS